MYYNVRITLKGETACPCCGEPNGGEETVSAHRTKVPGKDGQEAIDKVVKRIASGNDFYDYTVISAQAIPCPEDVQMRMLGMPTLF